MLNRSSCRFYSSCVLHSASPVARARNCKFTWALVAVLVWNFLPWGAINRNWAGQARRPRLARMKPRCVAVFCKCPDAKLGQIAARVKVRVAVWLALELTARWWERTGPLSVAPLVCLCQYKHHRSEVGKRLIVFFNTHAVLAHSHRLTFRVFCICLWNTCVNKQVYGQIVSDV